MADTTNWGNPFYKDYLAGTIPIYISTKKTHRTKNYDNRRQLRQNLTEIHDGLVSKATYNPDRDTGAGNVQYFVDNYRTTGDKGWEKPADENRVLDGFPFWISLFGWPDWIKKLSRDPQSRF